MEIQVRAARLKVIGAVAHHCWLVVAGDGASDRWEVWQRRDRGGESWGHLHRNLLAPEQGVGNGPSWMVGRWRGDAAAAIGERLARAPHEYPWLHRYLPWPGPNSNTFVRWVIGDAALLGWQALGKRYPVWRRAIASTEDALAEPPSPRPSPPHRARACPRAESEPSPARSPDRA